MFTPVHARACPAPYILLGLATIGLAVALYDSYAIYNGEPLWCPPPIDGCNEVAASPYARMLGLPVGYYGVAYYLAMLGAAALLALDPHSPQRSLAAILGGVLGLMFSLYFLVLQIGFIRAFCIYCLISALTTLLLSVVAIGHARRSATG